MMLIESVELRRIRLPLRQPFAASHGTQYHRTCLILTLTADQVRGYGECVAGDGPWYTYETIGTATHILREYLIPRLLQGRVQQPRDLDGLFAPIRGHPMARASLEMACWDLFARLHHAPLSRLLGGVRTRVPVGVSVGLQSSPEKLVDVVRQYVDAGYRRIKLKVAPGKDVSYVEAVRCAFPHLAIQIDANSSYRLEDMHLLRQFDDLHLLLIEQPLGPDDIIDHAVLQKDLRTPICLDESIRTLDDARHALDLGSCRVMSIKPGRVGGHLQSCRIHDLCVARHIPVWCGGMLETNIGRAHNVALASLPGFSLPGDISASERYYVHDIAGPNFVLNDDSTLSVPGGSGIGVELDYSALEEVTEDAQLFTPGSVARL